MKKHYHLLVFSLLCTRMVFSQSWDLTKENINNAIRDSAINIQKDPFRPVFHLVPPVGCMGDPNGGIYVNGWYHIFYGLQPFAFHPGGWYWAHAKSKDLLHWEHVETGLIPAFELGLNAIGSGSTIKTANGDFLAFYSQGNGGAMKFWRAKFKDQNLSEWNHKGVNPVLPLNHPGLPPFDGFWRDPYIFEDKGRYFLIACADLFEEDYVMVPIFEATNSDLTSWDYKGELFRVQKHKYRNLEVPEFIPIKDKWLFLASTDAPVDRVNYFIGSFDLENLKFIPEQEGPIDYSGHYYAQESILDDKGDVYLMAWIPGWDREWLPTYMNEPLKNSNPLWNGCFALPRKLDIDNGVLIQRPIEALKELRGEHFHLESKNLHVSGPMTAVYPITEFRGNHFELHVSFDLYNSSLCGINLLSDSTGNGGFFLTWSGNNLNVDGVIVPIKEWPTEKVLHLEIFIDKKFVEVFVNHGKYCITRQISEKNIKGDHISFTSLGGTAKMLSMDAWVIQ